VKVSTKALGSGLGYLDIERRYLGEGKRIIETSRTSVVKLGK
jgi:hypothetical protein